MSKETFANPRPLKRILATAGVAGALLLTHTACDDGERSNSAAAQSAANNAAAWEAVTEQVTQFNADFDACDPNKPQQTVAISFEMNNRDAAVRGDDSAWRPAPRYSDLGNQWFPDEFSVNTTVTYTNSAYTEQAQADAAIIEARAVSLSGAKEGIVATRQVPALQSGLVSPPFDATVDYIRNGVCPL